MTTSIVKQLEHGRPTSNAKWKDTLVESVEVYMQINSMSRESFIRELASLCEQSVYHRFETLLKCEDSDS